MNLPEDWICVNITRSNGEDQLTFINLKDGLISMHPPYPLKKINLFKVCIVVNNNIRNIITLSLI